MVCHGDSVFAFVVCSVMDASKDELAKVQFKSEFLKAARQVRTQALGVVV
jgi:hypothetical protein